jgi:hypothetical protein
MILWGVLSLARLQDRAALVHLAASSALGCAGGIIHESLGHPFPWRVYRTRLAATLMRGVAVSHPRSSRFFCYLPHRFVYRTGRPTTIQPRAAGGESHPKTPRRSRRGDARVRQSRLHGAFFYPVGGSQHELPGIPLPGAPKQRAALVHLAASLGAGLRRRGQA